MDIEARVTLIEDDINILNGEIKSVLLEVRTAFLNHANPFAKAAAPPAPASPAPAPAPYVVQPEPDQPMVHAVEAVVMETVVIPSTRAPAPSQSRNAPRFDTNTLAMLMAWSQGNMARLNLSEMSSLLALARYGEVIEPELEEILLNIADQFEGEEDLIGSSRDRPAATISEYLLALHELSSVINHDDDAFRWLRAIS
jgi:hypothetical protein